MLKRSDDPLDGLRLAIREYITKSGKPSNMAAISTGCIWMVGELRD